MAEETQNTLRETLEANFKAAEEGTLGQAKPAPTEPVETAPRVEDQGSTETLEQKADRLRDEQGRFAAKQAEQSGQATTPAANTPAPTAQPVATEPPIQRPGSWKKEYLPMWDKLAQGVPLTPEESKKLAQYNTQRESEFATGVSQYRTQAQQAQHLTEALTPYVPIMRERGLNAQNFIKTMGDTYVTLIKGSPEQKTHALAELANNVGVPLHAVAQVQAGGQLDPMVAQLIQQNQQVNQQVTQLAQWREQQEQQAALQMLAKFEDASKYPHYQQVKSMMGKLLENGIAANLDEAYERAVRLDNEAWQAEQAKFTSPMPHVGDKTAAVEKAKTAAVSTKSAPPSGKTSTVNSKDLRSLIESKVAEARGSARI